VQNNTPWLIAIMGPTGSGKTEVAEQLAAELNAQLINADAFQVYRGFDIGTAKPADTSLYELIDICEPDQGFGVGAWIRLVSDLLAKLYEEGRNVVIVGGTGYYVRALFEEYSDLKGEPDPAVRAALSERTHESRAIELLVRDPEIEDRVDMNNPIRVQRALERILSPGEPVKFTVPPFRKVKFGLKIEPNILDQNLEARARKMLDSGWEEELHGLQSQGLTIEAPAMRAIGYEQVAGLISGELQEPEAIMRISLLVRQYAKRQRTWLRSEPHLIEIEAAPGESLAAEDALNQIRSHLDRLGSTKWRSQ
jgi:tRNA dimethylallyltransferase